MTTNEQGQDEIEFTSQILYYPQKIQKKKKQKKKKRNINYHFLFYCFQDPRKEEWGERIYCRLVLIQ